MPVLLYDSVGYALNTVRSKMGDRMDSIQLTSGKVLDFTDAQMQQMTNSAWRMLQDELATLGYEALTNEVLILQLPPVAVIDPALFTYLNGTGYFDGKTLWPALALPSTFTHPLKVWERWSNQNSPFVDPPMEKMLDGLPTQVKTTAIRRWEWRGDTIFMPGSQMIEDLRIRYVQYKTDFLDSSTLRWYEQIMPIMRSSEALSWYVCAVLEAARAGGDPARAQAFADEGQAAAGEIFNRDVRADIRVNIRRRASSGRSRSW